MRPLAVPLRDASRALLEALYPDACALCGGAAPGALCCATHALPAGLDGARCGRCAARLPPGLPDGGRCAACRRGRTAFSGLVALGDWAASPGLRALVLAWKHGGRRDLAAPLARALGGAVVESLRPPALLVPVPLHPLRRLARGYDQARDLAAALGGELELPVARALRRRRATPTQGGPLAPSRSANVARAFAPAPLAARRLRGRAVWLVDDVVTSGATASECARTLRALGAAWVGVACLGRAGPQPIRSRTGSGLQPIRSRTGSELQPVRSPTHSDVQPGRPESPPVPQG